MAQLKAGSTVGGVSMLETLSSNNLIGFDGPQAFNENLIVNYESNLDFAPTYRFGGEVRGYVLGGTGNCPGNLSENDIVTFPFAAPFVSGTVRASLSPNQTQGGSAHSSPTDGYYGGGLADVTPWSATTTLRCFPFAATGPFSTTSIGNIVASVDTHHGNSSETTGYISGGTSPPAGSGSQSNACSFPFAVAPVAATALGTLASSADGGSYNFGNIAGFIDNAGNSVCCFPFSAPFVSATNLGSTDQAPTSRGSAGVSSDSVGYTIGGADGNSYVPAACGISCFPFATTFSSTNIGCLRGVAAYKVGISSTEAGYTAGGFNPSSPTAVCHVETFPFAAAPFTTTCVSTAAPGLGISPTYTKTSQAGGAQH